MHAPFSQVPILLQQPLLERHILDSGPQTAIQMLHMQWLRSGVAVLPACMATFPNRFWHYTQLPMHVMLPRQLQVREFVIARCCSQAAHLWCSVKQTS